MLYKFAATVSFLSLFATMPDAIQRESLPRRGFAGLLVAPLSDMGRKWAGYFGPGGVAVLRVFEPSPAEDLGILEGDIVLRVNGKLIDNPAQYAASFFGLKEGAKVTLTMVRKGRLQSKSLALDPFPKERGDTYDVVYDTVVARGSVLRVIVTKPKGVAKAPAFLFVQGNTCDSMEFLSDVPHIAKPLVTSAAKSGYVTMRLEKSGVGDSQGKPCSEIGFNTEVEGFLAALKKLKSYGFVDKSKTFIFGYSMGGAIAPAVAAKEPVKGIIVYGGIYGQISQYMRNLARSQAELSGKSPDQIAKEMTWSAKLWGEYLGQKKSPAEILKSATGDYKKYVAASFPGGQVFGRRYTFFQELNDSNIVETWKKVNADVLAIWGKADYISRETDHKMLVEDVNKRRRGSATLVELDATDHLFQKAKDFKESYDLIQKLPMLPIGFEPDSNPQYIQVVLDWLKERTK